jgi:hypothetical protein
MGPLGAKISSKQVSNGDKYSILYFRTSFSTKIVSFISENLFPGQIRLKCKNYRKSIIAKVAKTHFPLPKGATIDELSHAFTSISPFSFNHRSGLNSFAFLKFSSFLLAIML